MTAPSPEAAAIATDGRACPYCGSTAMRSVERERLGPGRARVLIACGDCGTVRGFEADRRALRALDRERRRGRRQLTQLYYVLIYQRGEEQDLAARGRTAQR